MYNDPNPVFEDWLKAMKALTFKLVDLILLHIRDDTQRQHFEFVLTGPTNIAVLEKLFQFGVKPDVKLLYLACEIGDTEAIQYLARLSVPLDVVYKGNSPLELAAKRDHCAVIDLLLELGAENLDRAMNVTRCDRCALRCLKADRQRQKLFFGRHGKALSALNTSHLETNVATFRKDLWASQDNLDACLVAASKATNISPRTGRFSESFVDSEKLFRGEQQQAFNDKIHTHKEWREKNIDTIIECLSDSRWQQRGSSPSATRWLAPPNECSRYTGLNSGRGLMQRGLSLLKLNYRSFSRIRQRGTSIEEKFGIISQEAKAIWGQAGDL
ncbi:MAG: hypothetical protein ASARMPREDX12_006137 [Alectoria sarmentosa]|nr:MAG: hypothetical protein ASARMPREDX12_006137 [Alectoria sarmentosa]